MVRRRFNQTAIMKKLGAKCEKCGVAARTKNSELTIHHKNHKSDDTRWENIAIYCRKCHSSIEGTDKKKRDYR